jgi:hypothetical protein
MMRRKVPISGTEKRNKKSLIWRFGPDKGSYNA